MKERAAVQVGCEIVAGMAAMAAPGASEKRPQTSGLRPQEETPDPSPKPEVRGPEPTLSVGVGISTGPAFVGNIQSSDRFIWTVIGNTVNLAARLQSMTRELDAAVAIDDTTFRRAGGETCAAFLRHADLPIRGRAQPETVHALPL